MSTSYTMYLTFDNEKERIVIHDLPETIKISIAANNDSVNICDLGDVTIFRKRAAKEIPIQSIFTTENSDPLKNIEDLIRWKNSNKPIHVICPELKLNMFCSIEEFSYAEKGGDVGTIYYEFMLKEYTVPKVRKMITRNHKVIVKSNKRVDNRMPLKMYKVKKGDSLYRIAKRVLGKASRWKEIAEINSIKSPYIIYIGQVLKMPR